MPSGNTDLVNLGPKVAAQTHVLYTLFRPIWVKLAHVREGTGGFLPDSGNASYLVAHPREWLDHSTVQTDKDTGITKTAVNPNPRNPSPKLIARRKLARYENIASAIMEAKKATLFREQPTRRVGVETAPPPVKPQPISADTTTPIPPPKPQPKPVQAEEPLPLEEWWEDVDGCGTHIDDAMSAWWDIAGTFGHVGLYYDLATPTEGATTAADEAWGYVRSYTPLDILDWRRDLNGKIVWVKLLEAIESPPDANTANIPTYRIRIVDEMSWSTYSYNQNKPNDPKNGEALDTGDHNLGRLPFVLLFAKRRSILTDIGESLLGDPQQYIDLFNMDSEVRELLRGQTFSFINLPLGSGPDAMSVEQAQAMMGSQTGTMNVLFSGLQAQMLSADAANVTTYQEEIQRVKREIFRYAGVQWVSDSKDAEAAQALELKQEELNTRLSAYADECQRAEYGLAELWYRAEYGPDGWESKFDADQVTIHYPEKFTTTPFDEVLKEVQAAQSIGMPAQFLKALRKAIVTKFEGMANLTPEQLSAITDAIDQAPDDPTPAERMRQKMEIMTKATQAGGKVPPEPKDVAA